MSPHRLFPFLKRQRPYLEADVPLAKVNLLPESVLEATSKETCKDVC